MRSFLRGILILWALSYACTPSPVLQSSPIPYCATEYADSATALKFADSVRGYLHAVPSPRLHPLHDSKALALTHAGSADIDLAYPVRSSTLLHELVHVSQYVLSDQTQQRLVDLLSRREYPSWVIMSARKSTEIMASQLGLVADTTTPYPSTQPQVLGSPFPVLDALYKRYLGPTPDTSLSHALRRDYFFELQASEVVWDACAHESHVPYHASTLLFLAEKDRP